MNAAPGQHVDAAYHQHTGNRFARRISVVARRRIHELFLATMRPAPGDRILDIGTSDDTGPDSNMLEQLYPHRTHLTCASLTDGKAILAAYRGVQHLQLRPGEPLPVGDNSFDIVYSNAVLEHVGSREKQKQFITEMRRVAPRRFLAVPNRGFPVEHHTALPLVHYLPPSWFRKLIRGTRYDHWAHEENLNYVSRRDLQRLWPGEKVEVRFAGIGFGPWKSNLVAWENSTS
ncbi:MAG TPA: class I SAM-dependent methyltransferase [Desulfuromonadaceae bacterium]|nr:class I SAM-dependent methyltransferase [Desulfuromonadaceae bacterium]